MSETTNPAHKTIDDPIDAETLAKFDDLEQAEMRLGKQLITLRSEELRIMVAARRIEDERQRLFEKVLVDRGMHPSTAINIDSGNGRISLVGQAPPADVAVDAPAAS